MKSRALQILLIAKIAEKLDVNIFPPNSNLSLTTIVTNGDLWAIDNENLPPHVEFVYAVLDMYRALGADSEKLGFGLWEGFDFNNDIAECRAMHIILDGLHLYSGELLALNSHSRGTKGMYEKHLIAYKASKVKLP